MLYLCIEKFKEVSRDEKKITYVLGYNKEEYLLIVPCDGEFHDKLYACEKEIPKELERFVEEMIRRDTAIYRCNDGKIVSVSTKFEEIKNDDGKIVSASTKFEEMKISNT